MAFPLVDGRAAGVDLNADATKTIGLPTSIVAGDVLLMCITWAGTGAVTTPSGWTLLYSSLGPAGNPPRNASFCKTATGSEGASVAVTGPGSRAAWSVLRISGVQSLAQILPEISADAVGSNSGANGLVVTPTGGADDYLYISVAHLDDSISNPTVPTNYLNRNGAAAGSSPSTWTAELKVNAPSENPGAWTTGSPWSWAARTIAVHPSASVAAPPSAGTITAAVVVHASKAFFNLTGGTGAVTHTLHRSTSAGFTAGAGNQIAAFGSVPPTAYGSTGMAASTTYYFKLRATNEGGSTDTAAVSITTLALDLNYGAAFAAIANATGAQWGHLRMNETTGNLIDSGPNGYHVSGIGGSIARGVPGLLGNDADKAVAALDASPSAIIYWPDINGQTPNLEFVGATTVCGWIYVTPQYARDLLIGNGNANTMIYSIEVDNTGCVNFETHAVTGTPIFVKTSDNFCPLNVTTFLLTTRAADGVTIRFYKNGVFGETKTLTGAGNAAQQTFPMFTAHPRDPNVSDTHATIFDEPAVIGAVLTDAAILALYDVGLNGGGGGGSGGGTGDVVVTSVTPNEGAPGTNNLVLSVVGANFGVGCAATFSGTGITVVGTVRNSATSLTVTIDIAPGPAGIGVRHVTVTNPDATFATLVNGFTVAIFEEEEFIFISSYRRRRR